jgi:transformation/transcription domain-associated protein
LPWIPQLLTCLARREGQYILNLLCYVGKAFPQAVYFPIRTLYLTLKKEKGRTVFREREREREDETLSSTTNSKTIPLPAGANQISENVSLPSLPPSLTPSCTIYLFVTILCSES